MTAYTFQMILWSLYHACLRLQLPYAGAFRVARISGVEETRSHPGGSGNCGPWVGRHSGLK